MRIYAISGRNWDVYITHAIESNISQFRAILRRFRALFIKCFLSFFLSVQRESGKKPKIM